MLKAIGKKLLPSIMLLPLLWAVPAHAAERLQLDTVLQRVSENYTSLQVAAKQVERAQQDVIAARSQLGWSLAAQGGISHDVSIFGTGITDSTSINVNVNRQLSSGGTLSVGTNLSDQNTDPAFPGFPNPIQSYDLEAKYRMPFGKGDDNPNYQFALNNSKAGVMMSQSSERSLRDQVGSQIVELFYGAAQAYEGLQNAGAGLRRAERLVEFIKGNMKLGLAEEKDFLQFDAQLRAARVELKNAELMWKTQRTALNKLMGEPWDYDFVPTYETNRMNLPPHQQLLEEAENYSPSMMRHQAEMMMADAAIEKARNDKESQLDLVMALGHKTRDASAAGYPASDFSYALQFEYSRALDKSGFDARLYQAQIDKDIAQQNIQQVKQDLQYDLNNLMAEVRTTRQSMELSKSRLQVEQERYDDVRQRYKSGRVDTSQLILAEGDLAMGEFNLKQKEIELAKRQAKLEALRGRLWNNKP